MLLLHIQISVKCSEYMETISKAVEEIILNIQGKTLQHTVSFKLEFNQTTKDNINKIEIMFNLAIY